MATYHFIMFTVLLFVQEEMEGFQTTIICWLLIFVDSLLFKWVSSLGFNFYETLIIIDLVFILLTSSLYGCHKNLKILLVFVISLFLNLGMLQVTDEGQYTKILSWYESVNLILFEILVWSCIITSKIHPYLLRINSWVDSKLSKFTDSRFKHDN